MATSLAGDFTAFSLRFPVRNRTAALAVRVRGGKEFVRYSPRQRAGPGLRELHGSREE